jgi:parallel beta-helix repeat protein
MNDARRSPLLLRRLVLAALVPLGLACAASRAAAPADASPAPAACTAPAEISGHVKLEPGCVYRQALRIAASDTTLDCQQALIDGEQERVIGLLIAGHGQAISHISVRNCRFRNFRSSAVRISADGEDGEKDPVASAPFAPFDVHLAQLHVEGSGRVGVYFDHHVHDASLRDSGIEGSGATAIYVEYGSARIAIESNVFRHNGFDALGRRTREAIAIDSSSGNRVSSNTFVGNGKGGVFLYKNCGEKASEPHSVVRTVHADDNVIRANRFVDEEVGVWIASRQSRNLRNFDCSDRPMEPTHSFFEDFANHNEVSANLFCDTRTGVRIEGDFNRVVDNTFDDATRIQVEIPVSKRATLLHRPAEGNEVDRGRADGEKKCQSITR